MYRKPVRHLQTPGCSEKGTRARENVRGARAATSLPAPRPCPAAWDSMSAGGVTAGQHLGESLGGEAGMMEAARGSAREGGEGGSWRPALETPDHRPAWATDPRSCAEAASRLKLVWIFSWASPIKNEIVSCKHRTLCPSIKHRPVALTPGRQETAGAFPSLRKAQMKGGPGPAARAWSPGLPMRGGGRGRWHPSCLPRRRREKPGRPSGIHIERKRNPTRNQFP